MRGPGTGAGGAGTGTGSGAGGSGPGGGGDNGVAEPPRLVSPVLFGRDFPRELLDRWPRRATVFLRLQVDVRGYVSECAVDRGTGVQAINLSMCNLAHDRLQFRPALNRSDKRLQDGSDTRNQHRVSGAIKESHDRGGMVGIDSLDELADAVAGDVGFIIESAVDARNASLIAIPGEDRAGDLPQARRAVAPVEAGDDHPDRRPAGGDGR